MEVLEVIPDPVSLIEAMRAVGYSTESAIADLLDNSITAKASRIDVRYDASDAPFVAILDNGRGMASHELTNAMRHGSHNPANHRDPEDLGRFGLGLKTASLSQCRKLTVISKKAGIVSARCWDLDEVRRRNKWIVVVPDIKDLEKMPMFSSLKLQDTGTLIVWQDLDRLTAGADRPQKEITSKLTPLLDHLALVFHRFTQRENQYEAIQITVNGLPVPARDPFLRSNPFRQPLEGQVIRDKKGDVLVSPFVLPPVSHLSPEEIDLAGGRDGLRGTQGFYIYRNRRLVIWGTWFRLVSKSEFFKLTRIQVDIPNSFDELWTIDIKKSIAYPPEAIRNRLRQLIPHFANTSRKTVTYQGKKRISKGITPLWTRIEPSHSSFRYEPNLEHPIIQSLSSKLDVSDQKSLQLLLGLLGEALPFDSIYADMCSDSRELNEYDTISRLVELATNLLKLTGFNIEDILNIDPLVRHPQYHEKIRTELYKC
ncbi:ATP-binding protein [Pseudomonas sp. RT6P73]